MNDTRRFHLRLIGAFPLRKTSAWVALTGFLLAFGPAVPAGAAPSESPLLTIQHDPLTCVTTVVTPLVDAGVAPGEQMATSYTFFRAAGTKSYYYVLMEGTAPQLEGKLPRPLPETKKIDYYVQARDRATLTKKTPAYLPAVVAVPDCKGKGLPVPPEGAGLTIGLTSKDQPPIPPGFNKDDIAKIILVTGAIVTVAAAMHMGGAGAAGGAAGGGGSSTGAASSGAAAGAGSSGGISTLAIVGGVVAVGAGVAIAASSKSSKSSPPPAPSLTFVEADASWSGPGNIDLAVFRNGAQVGQSFPVGCGNGGTGNRTARVLLQGSSLVNGSYTVSLTASNCGSTITSINASFSATSDKGAKCTSSFVTVPVGSPLQVCSFSVP